MRFLQATITLIVIAVSSVSHAMELRILLTKTKFPAVYFTNEDVLIEDGSDNLYKVLDENNLRLSMSGNKVVYQGKKLPLPVAFSNGQSRFFINGKGYRGRLEIKEINGKYVFINVIDLEDYLRGVVSREMPAEWPLEALKAQAVIARTYAIYKATKTNREGFDLYDSTLDQVYFGLEGESPGGDRAVKQTKDIVLLYNNEIIKSYYHSTSGGRTEEPKFVWGDDYPYFESTICGYDRESPSYKWEYSVPRKRMEAILRKAGFANKSLKRMRPVKYTVSGRNQTISLIYKDRTKATISGVDLRSLVGNVKIKSTKFQILNRQDRFIFRGKGSGHGVGLCQWGAKGMADKGFTFEAILKKYYRDVSLSKLSLLQDFNDDVVDDFTKDLPPQFDSPVMMPQKQPQPNESDALELFIDNIERTSPEERNRVPLNKVIR